MFGKDSVIQHNPTKEGDFLHKKPSEIQLMNENKMLKKEVAFLDNINFRLGKELTELQVKFNIHPGQLRLLNNNTHNSVAEESLLNLDPAKIAIVNRELSFLEPLLLAYDDKIVKMERMLETVYDDYRDMEKKADYLIQDNNSLREQLEQKCQLILTIYKDGPVIDNMGNAFLKLERDDLNERISLLSQENKELFAKFSEISGKYNEMSRRCEEQVMSAQKSLQQYLEVAEKCKNLEIEHNAVRHQKEVIEGKLKQCIEQQSHLEGDKQDMTSKLNRSENEIKTLKVQVSNLKRNTADTESKSSTEIEELRRSIDALKLRERETTQKLLSSEKELDYLKDENRKLQKERETLKSEQDQMIRMMDNYASKIATFEKKDENAAKLQKEQREKLQDALLDKDKAVLREQQVEKTLSNIQENQRQELNELKEQYERLMDNLKAKQKQILDERDEEIHDLSEQLTAANYLKDKLSKENQTLQHEYKKFSASFKDDFGGASSDKVIEQERRIQELEEKLQLTEQYHNDRNHSTAMEKTQIETSYKNQQNIINDLKASNDRYRQESQKLAHENSTMSSKVNSSQKEKQLVLEEIAKIKRLFENKLEYAQTQFGYKMKDVQDQLNEALKRERTSREKAIELLQTHDRIEEKMKYEYESRIKELEGVQLSLKEENSTLHQKYKRMFDERPIKDKQMM